MTAYRALTIQAGVWKQIANGDRIIPGSGIETSGVALALKAGTGSITAESDLSIDTSKNLSAVGGTSAFDFSAASGTFKTSSGAVSINGSATLAASKDFTAAGGTSAFDFSAASGTFKTSTGAVSLNGDVTVAAAKNLFIGIGSGPARFDVSSAGELRIGTTTATSITIGQAGVTATVAGNLTVTGVETVNGATTFNGSATFTSTTTFGDVASPNPDIVRFATSATPDEGGQIGDATYPDMPFSAGTAHTIFVQKSTVAGTAGTTLTMRAGFGANGSGATAGGAGAVMTLKGGQGGDGTATAAAGVGAALVLAGGNAGATGGGGGAVGGAITVSGGNASDISASGAVTIASGNASTGTSGAVDIKTGITSGSGGNINITHGSTSGTKGNINIGTTSDTGAIALGVSGIATTITGGLTQFTGAVSLAANAASSFTTSSGGLTLTAAASSTWSTSAGALTLTSAAAATWSTSAGGLTITSAAAATWSTTAGALTLTSAAAATWGTGVGDLTLKSGTASTEGVLVRNGDASAKVDVGQATDSAVIITAGAASSFTTSSGAVTITAAAASTWSTSAGALTVQAASVLTLNGVSAGIDFKGGGVKAFSVDSTGTTITVATTATLTTTGSGKIDLPISGNLLIGTVATSGTNFTAANFNKMWDGSVVSASLHSHAATDASQVVISGLTTTGLADGDAGYISANSTLTKAIATAMSTSRVFGSNEGTAGSMTVAGVIDNQNVDAGITILAGEALFLSKSTAGAVTNVAPSTSGEVVAELGIAQAGNGGAGLDVKMLLQIKSPVLIA